MNFNYPAELPVVAHHDEIIAALKSNQVIIVCGDTGSGKTTQLPKIALEAGFASNGRRIACTQPRRLAAVTMAERVADELGAPVGGLVGYQHRFGRRLSPDTRIKFMTDGVLLSESRSDPLLRAYDVIMVDEAHERSLNIDFLLGILKRLILRRRDLKVIVASATLDTASFSKFFDNAPTLLIPGRLYPIETRYLPPPAGEELDLARDVVAAVATLPAEIDILVFLPGERDIRETAEALEAVCSGHDEVIPLIASLPAAEQQRAFRLSTRRRIVLATNVAETSVTIPGIRAVIDSGLARISRYLHRTQVQRLQVESISQASARQRMGRCGRIGPGICIRLYSEEDFAAREPFTPPEVLRSSLAGVILTLLDLRLGDIAKFPFIDPPRSGMITEALRELIELGAVERDREGEPCLSSMGRKLARIPLEPRLSRMLIAASKNAVLPTALPIVAAISCDDPRRRPVDEREKAIAAHAKFRVYGSDFLSTLALWDWWQSQTAALSQSKLRKLCKETYLAYPKMREWTDLVHQLARLSERLGLDLKNDDGDDAALHQSLLTGLLGRVGHFDAENREYRGARGLRFALHPSSVLTKKKDKKRSDPPEWIVAGELVDTARLFARNAAIIDVRWLEPVAGAVCKHHYHSPEWDGASGFVRATEQVTLYGLVIVPARRCDYSRIDPVFARDIFIRRGLVDGEFPHPPPPVRRNTALIDSLRRRADTMRRPELFDAEALVKWFDGVIPAEICSAPALCKWLRCAAPAELNRFRLREDEWWTERELSPTDYPSLIRIGEAKLRLKYRNAPDDPATDGITCRVTKHDAAALRLWRSDWLVPGALPQKLNWMISVLPSAQRKVLTPIADTVSGLLARLQFGSEPLEDAVVRTVYEEWGFRISREAWRRAKLPAHLRIRFVIVDDERGHVLADSRELDEALSQAGVVASSSSVALEAKPAKHTNWTFGDLPEKTTEGRGGMVFEHFPALADEGDGVTLRLCADAAAAARAHRLGVTRLYLLALGARAALPFDLRHLPIAAAMYLKTLHYDAAQIASDILEGAVKAAFVEVAPPVRTAAEFQHRLGEWRGDFLRVQSEISKLVRDSLIQAGELISVISGDGRLSDECAEALQTQIVWLTSPGFPRQTPLEILRRYPRYLKGVAVRLERARVSLASDRAKALRFAPFWQRYQVALADHSANAPTPEVLTRYRWMLEEFRVSIFAQELRTPEPISEKRLDEVLPR